MSDLVAPTMALSTPRATYRIQLRRGVSLDGVVESGWLTALASLGVSHVYLSPVFAAAAGSTHGYDVVDHGRVDPAIGGDDGFDRFTVAARRVGLGVIVDLVPNHVAADPVSNEHWWDLLRNGPSSRWASMFDIEWDAHEPRLAGRLLLPVLGDHCGREIEAGRFSACIRDDGEPVLAHPAVEVPLELCSIQSVTASVDGLADLAARIGKLAPFGTSGEGDRELRAVHEVALRNELHQRLRHPDTGREFLAGLTAVVSDVDRLDDLLESQPYRLAMWRAGLEDLAYRRFFDVSNLVALRADRPEVFDATHAIVARWVASGAIDGVRVDHVDGLADPEGYLQRLRRLVGDRWLVVEKILEDGEHLPPWPIDGTTGYEVATLIDRLDVADAGRATLQHLAELAGAEVDVDASETSAMGQVLDELLNSDLNRLVDLAVSLCETRRRVRDSTRREIHDALVAMLSRSRRYRTYWRRESPPRPEDVAAIDELVSRTRREVAALDGDVVSFLERLARGDAGPGRAEAEFVIRFQQLSGPTRAKGCEDTAWYRLVTLISRCEVGANPDGWGVDLGTFHAAMATRQRTTPNAMTSISTHDSKRSADVRARIDTLSQWAAELSTIVIWWWSHAGPGPLPGFDLYALQTVFGTPGLTRDRLDEHLIKALREAKQVTSWLEPVESAEEAVLDRVHAMLDDPEMADAIGMLSDSAEVAARNAILSHALLAICVPGVPDLYQGSETWRYRLVDPDNRVPVDPTVLAEQLAALGPEISPLLVGPDDPMAKVALSRLALHLRGRRPELFGSAGSYQPLWATGARADHVVAFARGDAVLAIVPRLTRGVADGWNDTTIQLPEGRWQNLCSGEECSGSVRLDDLLAIWPVALLERVA